MVADNAMGTRALAVRVRGCSGRRVVVTYATASEVAFGASRAVLYRRAREVVGGEVRFDSVPTGELRLVAFVGSAGLDVAAGLEGEGECYGHASVDAPAAEHALIDMRESRRPVTRTSMLDIEDSEQACVDAGGTARREGVAPDGLPYTLCDMPGAGAVRCASIQHWPSSVAGVWWVPTPGREVSAESRLRWLLDLLKSDVDPCVRPCVLADESDAVVAFRVALERDVALFYAPLHPDAVSPTDLLAGDGQVLEPVVTEARVAWLAGGDSRASLVADQLCPACQTLPFDLVTGVVDEDIWLRWIAGTPQQSLAHGGTVRGHYLLGHRSPGLESLASSIRSAGGTAEVLGAEEEPDLERLVQSSRFRCDGDAVSRRAEER